MNATSSIASSVPSLRARAWSLVFRATILGLPLPTPAVGQFREFEVGPPEAWVRPYRLAGDGAQYLLADSQTRWDGEDSAGYYRVVTRVAEPEALSEASSLQPSFNVARLIGAPPDWVIPKRHMPVWVDAWVP